MDGEQNSQNPSEKSGAGPIIAVIIILALVILGVLYFWGERDGRLNTDSAIESIEKQSDSDDAASIEADLNSTDVENLDSEINAS